MKKFLIPNYSVAIFVLSLSAFCSVAKSQQEAPLQTQYQQVSDEFAKYFSIDQYGHVQQKAPSTKIKGVSIDIDSGDDIYSAYRTADDQSTSWYVGAQTCSKNKTFTCLSVYNSDALAEKSDFTLYRLNKEDAAKSSIIACSKAETKGTTFGENAALKNCNEYSRKICGDWKKSLQQFDPSRKIIEKNASPQTQIISLARSLRNQMRLLFQYSIPDFSEEIESNYWKSTKHYGGLKAFSHLKIENGKYTDFEFKDAAQVLIEADNKSKECDRYAAVFENQQTNYGQSGFHEVSTSTKFEESKYESRDDKKVTKKVHRKNNKSYHETETAH